jgi:aspartate ammonia-lyase
LARNACQIFVRHCVRGITANESRCRQAVAAATATVTALVDPLGYPAAEAVARAAQAEGKTVRQVVLDQGLLTAEQFDEAIAPGTVTRLGSRP